MPDPRPVPDPAPNARTWPLAVQSPGTPNGVRLRAVPSGATRLPSARPTPADSMDPLLSPRLLGTAQYLIEACAIGAFALSGVIEAARKRLDAVGICVVAGLAAFGGGTLRDVLLDRRPLFWVQHPELLWFVLLLSLGAILFMRSRHLDPTERAMLWPDAIGMGLFCASGTQLALDMAMPPLVAVVMGVITAIFGGVLRDVVCNDIPRVLRDHRPYALCAFAGAWVLVGLQALSLEPWPCMLSAAAVATGLRVLAARRDWRIPSWPG
jgi:uncharacterized membrane protein YeiH